MWDSMPVRYDLFFVDVKILLASTFMQAMAPEVGSTVHIVKPLLLGTYLDEVTQTGFLEGICSGLMKIF